MPLLTIYLIVVAILAIVVFPIVHTINKDTSLYMEYRLMILFWPILTAILIIIILCVVCVLPTMISDKL